MWTRKLEFGGLGGMIQVGMSVHGCLSLPEAPVQLTAGWVGLAPRLFCSRRSKLRASGQVRGVLRFLQPSSSGWNRTVLGPLLRVSAMDGNGDTSGTSAQGAQVHNLQFTYSSTSIVEGDEELGSLEYDPGIFTKFIDEQLLQILNNPDNPVRQTVLMTDGTDTRPYRLRWPNPSLVFDLSPGPAYNVTSKRQIEMGLKVPRSCLLQHVSLDFMEEDWGDEDLVENLLRKGYRGDALSAWVIQMPRELSEQSLQQILAVASCLLMKGSIFLGVILCSSKDTSEEETRALLRRLFVGQGFTLELCSYTELASKSNLDRSALAPAHSHRLPFAFTAQQLRLSDAQVEIGRIQMEQAEEIDEEGFEDSW